MSHMWRLKVTLKESVLAFSAMGVMDMKLRPSSLAANAFTS